MVDSKFFDDIAKKLADALPKGVRELRQDLERNFREILNSAFSKMELITREEFDVQARVLNKTRIKLEALEKRLDGLEKPEKAKAVPKAKDSKKS